ncbi:unnamed protein product [Fraxinus pennsylvanica]|uniref:Gag-Pol polyprotein/retrotransposon n=1 Tax=Fraxinus pennsylvanica TaxID=56036 RepID=A0AAD2DWP2_9LAMI|nr:unnamed protein product [Fraxinus pennsylvanica]
MSSTLRFPLPSSIINHAPPSRLASTRFGRMLNVQFFAKRHLLRLCPVSTNNSVHESADKDKSSVEKPGLTGNDDSHQALSPNEIMKRLKRYGTSGILSYGLLNTVYYLITFLVVWFYVSPPPARMGYLAAVERFLKVMAMVWAGSQVTKLVRAGGALALAPLVDRGLSWFTVKFNFESQGKAFVAIAGLCFGLAIMLFLVVTLLCA